MSARRPAPIGEARCRRGVMAASPTGPATDIVTIVARNPARGIVPKHGRGRTSQANLPWEKSMPFAKSLSHHRSRSQIEPARRITRRPDVNGDRALVIPLLRTPTRPAAMTMSARTGKAVAMLSDFAVNAFPNLLLAIICWTIKETLDGCAAYAEALYGVPFSSEVAEPVPAEIPPRQVPGHLSLVEIHARNDFGSRVQPASFVIPVQLDGETFARPGKKRGMFSRWRTALGIFIVAFGRRLRLARERRQAIAELRALDDRSLRDIGLSASDIAYIARDGARRE
jgi:uncharacterized protein YjiS (DUF1127 family)